MNRGRMTTKTIPLLIGIGLFLSAAIFWIANRTGHGSRLLVTLLGAWIIVLGTARVVAMQRQWDVVGYWTAQREALASLVSAAPDFAPDTFVVLLDGTAAFSAGNLKLRGKINPRGAKANPAGATMQILLNGSPGVVAHPCFFRSPKASAKQWVRLNKILS